MASWIQSYEDPDSRIALDTINVADTVWERDSVATHFEGRRYPVTARTDRILEEWTVTTHWWSDNRSTADAFLTLVRDAAVAEDSRLEVRLEPMNGARVDAVVQAVDIPQEMVDDGADVTVTFRRVA